MAVTNDIWTTPPHLLKKKFIKEDNWVTKIEIMYSFHAIMHDVNDGKWTVRKTSEFFNCSMGLASENLRLGKRLREVKNFKDRKSALNYLKENPYGA